MQTSSELRWFWPDEPPCGLKEWFIDASSHRGCSVWPDKARCDKYLIDSAQDQLGIKLRGGKDGVEVKGLACANVSTLKVEPFVGDLEIWCKWTSDSLNIAGGSLFEMNKLRWLRKFDKSASPHEIELDNAGKPSNGNPLPLRGCNVEITQITLPAGKVWWTLGFEPFGCLQTIANDLEMVAKIMALRQPPAFGAVLVASYPAWLKKIIVEE